MGVKTTEALLTEGMALAGRQYDTTDNRPLSDLIDWLSSVALGWPWAECKAPIVLTLPAGTNFVTFGGTIVGNAFGRRITRVEFPLEVVYGPDTLPDKVYQESFNAAYDVQYVPVGIPTRASYQRNVLQPGNTLIVFNKKPKTDTLIHVPYQFDPSVGLTLDDIPWYPNDLTMKTSVAYYAAKYHDGPAADKTIKLEDDLAIAVKNDKLKFGVVDSYVLKQNSSPRYR